jgi:hypothetical protein
MTAEICLMNRYAVVLGADSAVTVQHWDSGERKWVPRYFKGSNKIFQLSAHHPVGLMIYDSASLHAVPWEVIVKEFRASLAKRACESPAQYAKEFFAFIKTNPHFFPDGHHVREFVQNSAIVALTMLWDALRTESVKTSDDAGRPNAYRQIFEARRTEIQNINLPHHFSEADLESAIREHSAAAAAELEGYAADELGAVGADTRELIELAIEALFKTYRDYLGNNRTGIVVAGFGEHEIFPSYKEYECFGFLLDHLLVDEGKFGQISFDVVAEIQPFAQTSMVDTFEMGVSFDIYRNVFKQTSMALAELATRIQQELGVQVIPNLDQHIEQVRDAHTKAWLDAAKVKHREPLNRVIGSLPVNEMAELAETLISLQSLKEKVTTPSESVGGPVDVAVITRGDGFVWVKRKHYFDASLNPRYFARQRTIYDI